MRIPKYKMQNRRGFSLVELLVVILIVGVLSGVSYVAIQKAKTRALNEKVLDDLVAIANAMEDYKRDHLGKYPTPERGRNQNINCYYADATYAHDCDAAAFRQGMVDNALLGKRYLREVPTDPHTGSRYVYGIDGTGKYFQLAGLWEEGGEYTARTIENLARGFELPSIIRAYDGPNFVVNKGTYLPYSADHNVLTGTLDNINGEVEYDDGNGFEDADNGTVLRNGYKVKTGAVGSADIYFSDGSITHVDPASELELKGLTVDKNDKTGTVTKILLKLNLGKIWNKVVRLADNSEFRVETNAAIAGVRGSEFGIDGAGEVIVKDGEVWQKEKEGLDEDAPVEQLLAIEESDIDLELTDDPSDYLPYYNQDIPLHSGMRPHVLGIRDKAIHVRNVNHFVQLVNDEQGFDRQVQVSRIAAYGEPFLTTETTLTPLAVTEGTLATENPHLLPIRQFTDNMTLFLRFEYLENDKIVRASSFTPNPLTVNASTTLSQYDLYPDEYDAPPELVVQVPGFVPLPSSGSTEFPLNFEVLNYDGTVTYIVTATSPCAIQGLSANNTITDGPLTVEATAEGICSFVIEASLENDESLRQDSIQVQIVAGTSQLYISKPSDGAQLTPGEIRLEWETPNAPDGVTFNLEVTGPTPSSSIAESALPGHSFNFNTDETGSYTWTVTMFDQSGSEVEDKSSTFEVISDITVDFSCDPGAGTQATSCDVMTPLSETTAAIDLTLQPAGFDSSLGYDYDWAASKADVTLIPSTSTGDVEVQVPLPTPFKSPDHTAFDVTFTLTVSNPNAGTGPSFIGSQSYTYRFQPVADVTIDSIAFTISSIELTDSEASATFNLTTKLGGTLEAALSDGTSATIGITNCRFEAGSTNNVVITDYDLGEQTLNCHLDASQIVDVYTVSSPLSASVFISVQQPADPLITEIAFMNTSVNPPVPVTDDVPAELVEGGSSGHLHAMIVTVDNGSGPEPADPPVSVDGNCAWELFAPSNATTSQIVSSLDAVYDSLADGLNRLICTLDPTNSNAVPTGYRLGTTNVTTQVEIDKQAVPVFEVQHSAPYYALNANIPFGSNPEFNPTDFQVLDASGATAANADTLNSVSSSADIDVIFTQTGTYTVRATDGNLTADSAPIDVKCGYVGAPDAPGGNECWVLGADGGSCTQACEGVGLSCEAGDWNDDTGCTVCNALASTASDCSDDLTNNYAPFASGPVCRYRATSLPQNYCSLSPETGRLRLCKCQ